MDDPQKNSITLDFLDNDCLFYIFTFLPIIDRIRIQRVCKRFQEISKLPWRDIKFIEQSSWISKGEKLKVNVTLDVIEKVLLYCGQFIPRFEKDAIPERCLEGNINFPCIVRDWCQNMIVVRYNTRYPYKKLKWEYPKCSFSNSSRGYQYNVYDQDSANSLLKVINASQKIKIMKICFLHKNSKSDIIKILESIAEKGENIEHLRLSFGKSEIEIDMRNYFKNMSNLRYLELDLKDNVSDELLKVIAGNCKLLESVKFRDTIGHRNSMKITDEGLAYLSNLKEVKLERLKYVTGTFFSSLTKLEKVKIIGVRKFSDENFKILLDTAKNLKEVEYLTFANENVENAKRYFHDIPTRST